MQKEHKKTFPFFPPKFLKEADDLSFELETTRISVGSKTRRVGCCANDVSFGFVRDRNPRLYEVEYALK